jgi:FtsH-binding integral membrane protein
MDTKKLETALEDIFVKKAPALPASAKKAIAEYLPWINLVLGFFGLWSTYWLWQWAHTVNRLAEYVNYWSAAVGAPTEPVSRMNLFVWLSIAGMLAQAILYLLAFSPLKARKKSGWNLLFYAMLVYVVVGLVGIFIGGSYGGFGRFIGNVIGAAIGMYFLFQIKSEYQGKPTPVAPNKEANSDKK